MVCDTSNGICLNNVNAIAGCYLQFALVEFSDVIIASNQFQMLPVTCRIIMQ